MRILIAPDKFKGTLSAEQVCSILSDAWRESGHDIISCPLADGGEGTARILTGACGGQMMRAKVHDALMRPVSAEYGLSPDGKTAFLELSSASGLWRLNPEERNPERTTTYGTGELIRSASEAGAVRIMIGCGGSATNDGGLGMAQALGFRFMDESEKEVPPVITEVHRIRRIVSPDVLVSGRATFEVISDVENILTGTGGASATFGPQKGADPDMVVRLDRQLTLWGGLLDEYSGTDVSELRGAGAGGGFTAGAVALLKASTRSGIDVVMEATGLEDRIRDADLVITGEGQLDDQSRQGKAVSGVARLCRKWNKPLRAVCGRNLLDGHALRDIGIQRVISLSEVAGYAAWTDPSGSLRTAAAGLLD